jgi:uncharacterized low-complexity protein
MSDKSPMKPLAFALSAAFATSLAAGSAMAAGNPFGQSELAGGYMVADNHGDKPKMEGKCGEGKCGADKTKAKAEGMCGADKTKAKTEGKCGEGKCGAMNKAQKQGDKAATPETPDAAGTAE